MINRWPLVEFLLCAADLARCGHVNVLSAITEGSTGAEFEALARLAFEARAEALAVSPRAFDYRNELLAETLLEAAYRAAEGRGVS